MTDAAFGSGFAAALGVAIRAAFWHRRPTQLVPRREQLLAVLRDLGDAAD